MSNIGAPQQHKQPSRKGKKAWRKNVDVTEVQSGLEALRDEIRSGGPVSEKQPEDLFALDTVGSQEISKKYDLRKPLKADEILSQRSAVPAIDSRKRPGTTQTTGIYEPASKRRKGDWVSKKDVRRLRKTINSTSHLEDRDTAEQNEISDFDLWSVAPVVQSEEHSLEYIPKQKPKTMPETIRRPPTSMTASGRPVRAVQNPAAGTSYNPSFEEWDERLVKEGGKEVKAEQSRIQQAVADAEKKARVEAAAADEAMGRTDDESAWEGFETDNEDAVMLRKKRPTRKTPAERNKAIRKKNTERLAKHEKKMGDKKRLSQQLEEISKPGPIVEAKNSKEPSELVENSDDSRLRRRKMGNAVIPQQNLELVLPDELQDSLRLLKPEGNLLQDRFRNLLVNGKVESRKAVSHPKKKRVKYTEKWSHKDFEIQV